MTDLTSKAAEIRSGLEGVTPGEWYFAPGHGERVLGMFGTCNVRIVCEMYSRGVTDVRRDLAHIARLDPATVLAFLDERDRHLALIEQQAAELAAVTKEAHGLAVALWRDHYREAAPDWQAFDDAVGLLTQIDNMTAGLRERLQAERAEHLATIARLEAEIDRLTPKPPITDEQRAQERERQRLVGEAQNSPTYWHSIYPDGNFPEGV